MKAIHLRLSDEAVDLVEKLAKDSGAESTAEVVRRALAVYADLFNQVQKGRKVALLEDGRSVEIVKLVP